MIAAWAIAWFFYRYPRGKLVATSGSFNQLQNQLWPAVVQFLPPGSTFTNSLSSCTIRTPQGGRGIGFSTNDPGKAEGFHPTISPDIDPVFILVDEAKTVPNEIFTAFDRCTSSFKLYISSAGEPKGRFFDTFGKLSRYFWSMRVPSTMCPHIKASKREMDLETYPEDTWEFRSMHLAEFVDQNEERLTLSPMQLTNALKNQPEIDESGETVAFCDFAAGRDENVLAIRRGNKVRVIKAWREKDTVEASREFINLFKLHGLSAGQIWGDADGLGIGLINDMASMGWRINHFRGGAPASLDLNDKYASLISQVWHLGCHAIRLGRVNIEGLSPRAFEQLTTRKSKWNDRGKLGLQSKEELPQSPDHGDAILGCIGCGARLTGALTASAVIQSAPSPFRQTAIRGFNRF